MQTVSAGMLGKEKEALYYSRGCDFLQGGAQTGPVTVVAEDKQQHGSPVGPSLPSTLTS